MLLWGCEKGSNFALDKKWPYFEGKNVKILIEILKIVNNFNVIHKDEEIFTEYFGDADGCDSLFSNHLSSTQRQF